MSEEEGQVAPTPSSNGISNDKKLDDMVELRVRRILSELEGNREKAIIESLQSQRDFLIGNTKWVVTGFFGLLIVFGALVTFIFGSQIDQKYFDAVIGESLSETVETKIEASIDAQSKESLDATRIAIQNAAEQQQRRAVEVIEGAVDTRVDQILNEQVLEKIEQAQAEFLSKTSEEIIDGLIPPGAVLAFDRPDGCPAGWVDFEDASSRFILGAHRGRIPFRGIGGAETHTLTIAEMPRHSHPIMRTDRDGDGNFVKWTAMGSPNNKSTGEGTADVGDGQPHNNMPPYIALFFCKKEGG